MPQFATVREIALFDARGADPNSNSTMAEMNAVPGQSSGARM